VVLFVGLVAYAASDKGRPPATGANPARLGSLESNRYAYWGVAIRDGFAKRPLNGLGAGGFSVAWLQHRSIRERTRVAHSLYIETLAELGLVGFALLAVFYGGIAASGRRAYRADPLFAAGPAAALVTYAAHAAVDWDWEMPALTLVAIALAGLLIAAADRRGAVGEGIAAIPEAQPAPVAP
jgi:O-antigen ligase